MDIPHLFDEYGHVPEEYYYEKFQAVDIPRVKVVDENGVEVFRGYHALHFNRTPCIFDDEHKLEDVEHLVVGYRDGDWNLPTNLIIKKVTPPHTIQLLD